MQGFAAAYRVVAAVLVVVVLVDASCGKDANPTNRGVTVFAAASLTNAFGDMKPGLAKDEPHLDVTYSFGGSGALVTQIEQGAPADVIATADLATMKRLFNAGLVILRGPFARNSLTIVVAPGNPKQIATLGDLGRDDVVFVTEDASVPAGQYAKQLLDKAGVVAHPKSFELDVKAAVAKVTSGQADATIAYVTDVKAVGASASGVAIPSSQNVVAEYWIAIVGASKDHAPAQAFIDFIQKGGGRDALTRRGFRLAA
jgi:molybdate transport system substrate-binding protein